MRKAVFPSFLLFFVLTVSLCAQNTRVVVEDATDKEDTYFKIGALAGLTLAMNTTDYNVSQVSRSLGLGSSFGVRASIPIGGKTRFVAGIGYHTLSFSDENNHLSVDIDNVDHRWTLPSPLTTEGTFQYTVVTAMLQFGQFFIGMNVGLPASSEMTNSAGFTIPEGGLPPPDNINNPEGRILRPDITPETDDLNTLLELRAGGEFPVVKTGVGDLNFGISLGWTFNKILKESYDNLPNMEDQFYLPNVLFQVSYMFNI
ncbi:MAG: hypothetical protein RRA94_15685 [Bacteroidota bacterium]|nr:hypothetical protein [Bacteroidota bacterium]